MWVQRARTTTAAVCLLAALFAAPTLQAQADPATQAAITRMDACERTFQAHPSDPAARAGERDAAIAAALAARRSNNAEQALSLLLRANHRVNNDPTLLRDTGVLEEQMKLYKDASATLAAAHAADPGNPVTLYAIARVDMDLGQTAAAAAQWRAYLALKPQDASAHYAYGLLLEEANQSAQATSEFEHSIQLQPLQVESYYRLGDIRREAGHPAAAAALYRKALARAPSHPGALTGLAILAFQAQHYSEANRDLEQAIAAAPDFQTARYYHGLTLAKLGKPAQAQAELKLAVQLANRQNLQSASATRQLAPGP